MALPLVFYLVCINFVSAEVWKTYEGYKVLSIRAPSPEDHALVGVLQHNPDLDFWDELVPDRSDFRVLVPPEHLSSVSAYLNSRHLGFSVTNDNVARNIAEERARLTEKFAYDSNDFNRFEDIMSQLDVWAADCPEGFSCSVDTIGQSVEGRPLNVFRLERPGATRPVMYFDSLIHAREWLCGATVLSILEKLVTQYGEDDDVTRLLDAYDVHVLPVVNPDGYVFSWEGDRYWRKSRNVNEGSACRGTDINRNFDVQWGTDGISFQPCSDIYCGSGPASEPETQAVQEDAVRLAGRAVIWHTWHSKATMILHPWGHREGGVCARSPDHDKQNRVGEAFARAIRETYNEDDWPYGNSCETIYATSGSTSDYVYAAADVVYTYTPETRGDDWVIAPAEIAKSTAESWNGVLAVMDEVAAIEGSSRV